MWFRHFLARLKAVLTSVVESLDEPMSVAAASPPLDDAFHNAVTAPQRVIERPVTLLAVDLEPPVAQDNDSAADDASEEEEPESFDTSTTMPLMRLSPPIDRRRDQPAHALPIASEPAQPTAGREPTQPSQPLAANLQRLQNLADTEALAVLSDLDESTRRLLFLRRLVRQRIYNEGFSVEQIPAQYRRSHGLGDDEEAHN